MAAARTQAITNGGIGCSDTGCRFELIDGTSPERLVRLVEDIHRLPVFPNAGIKLLEAFKNPDYSVKQLAEIIAGDVGLSARVLSIANSSYYGVKNRITSVSHAVMMLGAREVEHLAMTLCFLQISPQTRRLDVSFSPTRYIEHSLFVGRIAQFLAGEIGLQTVGRGEAYAAGLLHDIGLFVLFRFHPEQLRSALRLAESRQLTYNEAEMLQFGASHAALGAWLAERWNFPRHLCEAIAYHHVPPPSSVLVPELVALLKLSKRIAIRLDVRNSVDADVEPLDEGSLALLAQHGFPAETGALVETLCAQCELELNALYADMARILRGSTPPRRTMADVERGLVSSRATAPTPRRQALWSRVLSWLGL